MQSIATSIAAAFRTAHADVRTRAEGTLDPSSDPSAVSNRSVTSFEGQVPVDGTLDAIRGAAAAPTAVPDTDSSGIDSGDSKFGAIKLDRAISTSKRAKLKREQEHFSKQQSSEAPNQSVAKRNQALAKFLHGRNYWIGSNNEVWKVESSKDGSVTLHRTNDADGILDADIGGMSPSQPRTAKGSVPTLAETNGDGLVDPDRVSASSAVTIESSGRVVTDTTTNSRWDSGVTKHVKMLVAKGASREASGVSSSIRVFARRADGSSATIEDTSRTGMYSSNEFTAESSASITIVDSDGTARTMSDGRPTPRTTPTTTSELRSLQDEYGAALDRLGPDAKLPTDPVERVFAQAETRRSRVDLDTMHRALRDGARTILETNPDEMTASFKSTLDQIQKRFSEFGLDEKHGNFQIAADWVKKSKKLGSNAQFVTLLDRIQFGLFEDGTPNAICDDVVAHELTHRLVNRNGMPDTTGEAGAINESLADTMAATIDQEDWLIGEDAATGDVRDMSRPATYSDFVRTSEDHGGVHANASIGNYAAYRIGSTLGRDSMGRIYARAIMDGLKPGMTYRDLATATYQAAVALYGVGSHEVETVIDAWNEVLELDGSRTLFPGWDKKPVDVTKAFALPDLDAEK